MNTKFIVKDYRGKICEINLPFELSPEQIKFMEDNVKQCDCIDMDSDDNCEWFIFMCR